MLPHKQAFKVAITAPLTAEMRLCVENSKLYAAVKWILNRPILWSDQQFSFTLT